MALFHRSPDTSLIQGSLRFVLVAALGMGMAVSSTAQDAKQTSSTDSAAPQSASTVTLGELQRMIERGHAEDALKQLDQLAAPASGAAVPAGVERVRGLAFYSQNKLSEAERAFAAAIKQDPADRVSTQMAGITLYRLGRPAAAIPLLEGAARLKEAQTQTMSGRQSSPVDPQYVLALCYVDTRRYDDARHAFAAQYGFPPDSAPAYLLAARMLLRREYIPVAQEFARKALELSPQLPLAHRLLGETQLAGNHLEEAIAELQKERTMNPLDPATYDRLGDAYTRQGDFDSARQALQEAILLDPNATGPFILLGKVLLKQQDAAGASTYLEHARGMDPQNYMTHSLLGQAYRQMGRQDEAKSETDTAEKLQAAAAPKLIDAH